MLDGAFGLKFEGRQVPKPDLLAFISDEDWQDTVFASNDYYPCFASEEGNWVEVEITEAGEIYKREVSLELDLSDMDNPKQGQTGSQLEKVEDFTGEVFFQGYFINSEDKEALDVGVIFKAVFHNGIYERVEQVETKQLDPSNRKESMGDKMAKEIVKKLKLMENPYYKYLYTPYKIVLTAAFIAVGWVWNLPLRALGQILKWITPI